MKELKPMKEGKVREIYDNGDSLIMVAGTGDLRQRRQSDHGCNRQNKLF